MQKQEEQLFWFLVLLFLPLSCQEIQHFDQKGGVPLYDDDHVILLISWNSSIT